MFQVSLRHTFIVTSAVALAVVSLWHASTFWENIICLYALLATLGALFYAILERGPRQAFAIGFTLTAVGYGLLVANGAVDVPLKIPNIELVASQGKLPTTRLLNRLYRACQHSVFYYVATGDPLSRATAENIQKAEKDAAARGIFITSLPIASRIEPSETSFTAIGQCWWGIFLGFLVGILARLVVQRIAAWQTPEPTPTS